MSRITPQELEAAVSAYFAGQWEQIGEAFQDAARNNMRRALEAAAEARPKTGTEIVETTPADLRQGWEVLTSMPAEWGRLTASPEPYTKGIVRLTFEDRWTLCRRDAVVIVRRPAASPPGAADDGRECVVCGPNGEGSCEHMARPEEDDPLIRGTHRAAIKVQAAVLYAIEQGCDPEYIRSTVDAELPPTASPSVGDGERIEGAAVIERAQVMVDHLSKLSIYFQAAANAGSSLTFAPENLASAANSIDMALAAVRNALPLTVRPQEGGKR